MSDRDYYEILGVMPGADGPIVDQAYWHMARKYQAAAVADPRARTQLDDLNEAYGVLGTPRLRTQYDAFREDVLVQGSVKTPKRRGIRRLARPNDAPASDGGEKPRLAFRYDLCAYVVASCVGLTALIAGLLGAPLVVPVAAMLIATAAALAPTATRSFRLYITGQHGERETEMEQQPSSEVAVPHVATRQRSSDRDNVLASGRPERVGPTAKRSDSASATEIHASTAAMISRWRSSVGLKAPSGTASDPDRQPDTTLVEIFQSEHEIDSQSEPLTAVIDILRGSRQPSEFR